MTTYRLPKLPPKKQWRIPKGHKSEVSKLPGKLPKNEKKFLEREIERLRETIPKDVMTDKEVKELAEKNTIFNPWRYKRTGPDSFQDRVTGKKVKGDKAKETFRKLRGERIVRNIQKEEKVSRKDARGIYKQIINKRGERGGLWFVIQTYGTN